MPYYQSTRPCVSVITQPVEKEEVWEEVVSRYKEANFLSSWYWGEFHKTLGKKVFYRGYTRDKKLIGLSLFIFESARRGKYLTVAGGPLLDWNDSEVVSTFVADAKKLATDLGAVFVRVRPQILDTLENRQLFEKLGFTQSPMHLTADLTLQLNLEESLEQILAAMRKSTRYEIKKAAKLGIELVESEDAKDIKEFYHHQLSLAKKHGFVPFSLEFLTNQFRTFANRELAKLIHAYYQGQLLASAFVIFYGKEAVYHYGISTPANQHLPGSYAVNWHAIKKAQELGMDRYNFWGIAPLDARRNHRFAGVSMFKRGFGGQEVAYLKAHDLVISKSKYVLTKGLETIRAKARRLD